MERETPGFEMQMNLSEATWTDVAIVRSAGKSAGAENPTILLCIYT
jgi:hypothetical protein